MQRSLLILLCAGLLLVSCGDDEAGEAEATEVGASSGAIDPPLGLSADALPATMAEVQAVFQAMPESIEGTARLPAEYGFEARYGELNTVVAVEVGAGTCGESLAFFEDEAGAAVETSQLDPAAPVLWMFGSFEDAGAAGAVQLAQWCEPAGTWIFTANVESREMRDAVIEAFVDSARSTKEGGPVEASEDLAALEELRDTIPSESELSAMLDVSDLSLEVVGGPGVTDWVFEHTDTPGLIGGYLGAFRSPSGIAGNGSISLSLFESETDPVALLDEIPLEPEIIRSEFPVTGVLAGGRGIIYNPEPGSHFTDVIGHEGPVLVHVMVFHGAEDDMVDEVMEIVGTVVGQLESVG